MGGFVLVRTDERRAGDERLSAASKSLARQGFSGGQLLQAGAWSLVIHPKQSVANTNYHRRDERNFCFATGTLIYRGRTGEDALRSYFDDFRTGGVSMDEAYGAYCLGVCADGLWSLHTDPLGVYKVYRSSDGGVYSSSFLAVAASVAGRVIDAQGVYEYVFEGATFGDRTVLNDVRQLPCGVWNLDRTTHAPIDTGIRARFSSDSFDAHMASNLETLRRYFRTIVDVYGERIDSALSGGFDSRLMLALLREQGARPRLHVYGRPSDSDVLVAKAIAEGEGLDLEHVDKSTWRRPEPSGFEVAVDRNFWAFDGCPTDGILDSGADLETRLDRCRSGEVMLNGGGGEIFRNFFYMPDRRFSIRQFLWTFYSRFDPAVCAADRFTEAAYHQRLGQAVAEVLGISDREFLERTQIELLYPVFRCRFWMGRNNSLNNRFGFALTPFIDHAIVRSAVQIPFSFKQHGAFEAAMISRIDRRLAGYPSNYGHDLLAPIPIGKRLKNYGTILRPPFIRHHTFRWKHRLSGKDLPDVPSPAHLERIIDTTFPCMSAFFDVRRMRDREQLQRVCTLEYFFTRLPSMA